MCVPISNHTSFPIIISFNINFLELCDRPVLHIPGQLPLNVYDYDDDDYYVDDIFDSLFVETKDIHKLTLYITVLMKALSLTPLVT